MRTTSIAFLLLLTATTSHSDPPAPPPTGDVQFCFLIASKAAATEKATSVRVQVTKRGAPPFDVTLDFPKGTTSAQVADAFVDRLTKAGHKVEHVKDSKCLFVFGVAEYDGRDPNGVIEVTFGSSEGPKRMTSGLPTFQYQGWVEVDRWGGPWLSNGVHSVQFAEEVDPKAKPFLGKPVEIDAGHLFESAPVPQTLHPDAIRQVAPRFGGSARLELLPGEAKLRHGSPLPIALSLKYSGSDAIEFRQRDFHVLVRRVGAPIPDTALDLRDRDGLAWRADGTSTFVLDEGKGNHDTLWVLRSPGEGSRTVKAPYSYGTELLLSGMPAGSYELWATFDDLDRANLSKQPGVRSQRFSFDVGS